jgi:hypothetical protein
MADKGSFIHLYHNLAIGHLSDQQTLNRYTTSNSNRPQHLHPQATLKTQGKSESLKITHDLKILLGAKG